MLTVIHSSVANIKFRIKTTCAYDALCRTMHQWEPKEQYLTILLFEHSFLALLASTVD